MPLALAYMRSLELLGGRVLNGADVFALELSKSAQATLLRTLGIDCPRSLTFNDTGALRAYSDQIEWPALLKPDQGGSGARIQVVESLDEIDAIFTRDPANWLPDNLFLLQEYLPHDPDRGIVRLEFLGGELLYAMRVITHGRFNLCPSPVCNPDDGDGVCAVPEAVVDAPPVEFVPYPDVPADAVETATRIVRAAKLDVGGIEYLETPDGPARLLRHQRQLEPASVGRRRIRVRPVRARGRLSRPRARAMKRCAWAGDDAQMRAYHDEEWGVPQRDSRMLWEMLMLEGFQAGLVLEHHPAQARRVSQGVRALQSAEGREIRQGRCRPG